ncbi:MAG TPA: transglycosylase domain-containing protein, partial [Bacteroidales bacterium]|nr:transglycosylase domain-containing protein [Bacteroidales bacterium]
MLTLAIIFASYMAYQIHRRAYGDMPDKEELQKIQQAQATEVYTRFGTLMGRYYFENRNNIRFDQIPEHIIHALVATEDARFYEHHGVDARSLFRVFFKTILLGEENSGGGSTITQQLAKNLFPRRGSGHIALVGTKIREMILAWRLEDIYDKEELIQMYLNTVPFGESTYGIKNASQLYFNCLPGKLETEQGAVLVGMLKGTSLYNPHKHPDLASARRNIVLSQMHKYGYLDSAQAQVLKLQPLRINYHSINHNNGLAPYLREHLRPRLQEWCNNNNKPNGESYNLYTDGLKVYTTIDADLQQYSKEAVKKHMPWLQQQLDREQSLIKGSTRQALVRKILSENPSYRGVSLDDPESRVHQEKQMELFTWDGPKTVRMSPVDSVRHYLKILRAGFMAMDPKNGHILAWLGGIDHRFFKYDHVTSRRQVGSTFKPVVYANALKNGIEPCDYFPNDSLVYTEYDQWSPANASGEYGGVYSVKGGLVHSVNTVSVQLLMEGGIDSTIALAGRMGLDGNYPRVPSLALGTLNASVKQMAEAYTTFANDGIYRKGKVLYKIENQQGEVLEVFHQEEDQPQRILTPSVSEQVTMMLQGVVDRGTARSLKRNFRFDGDIAGKTGTTQDHADGWFVGFNPNLVFAGWVGAAYPAVHFRNLQYG